MAPFMDPRSVLILGLDNAGKTVVLYCLKLNEGLDYTIPTIGINAEEVVLKGITLRALDLGGQSQFRDVAALFSRVRGRRVCGGFSRSRSL